MRYYITSFTIACHDDRAFDNILYSTLSLCRWRRIAAFSLPICFSLMALFDFKRCRQSRYILSKQQYAGSYHLLYIFMLYCRRGKVRHHYALCIAYTRRAYDELCLTAAIRGFSIILGMIFAFTTAASPHANYRSRHAQACRSSPGLVLISHRAPISGEVARERHAYFN